MARPRAAPWIEAAKKRLHHNVLAIALANKLARIAWSVLAHGRAFETNKDRKEFPPAHVRPLAQETASYQLNRVLW